MKKMITATVFVVLIAGCKKTKDHSEPAQELPVYGQVLSYSSNAPLSGAIVVSSKCIKSDFLLGCVDWDDKTSVTAGDGSFSVLRDYFRNFRIDLPGYWSYINLPDVSSWGIGGINQSAPIQYIEKNGKLEKVIIKLLPEVTVNVHIKNTSVINDQAVLSFNGEALHTNPIPAKNIYLRKGIDTTFAYKAFGGINNRFRVTTNYYASSSSVTDTLYSNVVLLNTGSNISLVINF